MKTYNLTQENKQRVKMLIKMFGNQSFDLNSEYAQQMDEPKMVSKTEDYKSVLPKIQQ